MAHQQNIIIPGFLPVSLTVNDGSLQLTNADGSVLNVPAKFLLPAANEAAPPGAEDAPADASENESEAEEGDEDEYEGSYIQCLVYNVSFVNI